MSIFLATYHPLVRTAAGRRAIERHHLPPYADDSIRREPDLESRYPSISAICHAQFFAPRLNVGDTVVYMTIKGRYPGGSEPDHRVVAILQVLYRFESHRDAATWYRHQKLPLPRNCMVPGNAPLPVSMATPKRTCDDEECSGRDAIYRRRAKHWGTFLVCEPQFLALENPPGISDGTLAAVFGEMPHTRTPPKIAVEQYQALIHACGISLALQSV